MRIAIAQMPMGWTLEENTRSIVEHLAQARALGADVALFPECATTGFHRQVPGQTSPHAIRHAIDRVRAECRALGMPAVFGSPIYPTDEGSPIWNAAVVVDAGGEVLAVSPKVGLTESEHKFFHAGTDRPTFALGGASCAVVLCREVRDAEAIRPSIDGVRVVFWPGAIAWDNPVSHPESVVTREIAAACARALGAYLVQCNWPNSLNDPQVSGMGGSLVISPTGEIVHACLLDAPGISLVTLDLAGVEAVSDSAPISDLRSTPLPAPA